MMKDRTPEQQELVDAVVRIRGGAGMCSFRCPKCGSSHFGSTQAVKGGPFTRHCHGPAWTSSTASERGRRHCGWSGPTEDALPDYYADIELAGIILRGLCKDTEDHVYEWHVQRHWTAPEPHIHCLIGSAKRRTRSPHTQVGCGTCTFTEDATSPVAMAICRAILDFEKDGLPPRKRRRETYNTLKERSEALQRGEA